MNDVTGTYNGAITIVSKIQTMLKIAKNSNHPWLCLCEINGYTTVCI